MIKTALDIFEKECATLKHSTVLIESEVSEDIMDELCLSEVLESGGSEIDIDFDAIDIALDSLSDTTDEEINRIIDFDLDDDDYDIDDILGIDYED